MAVNLYKRSVLIGGAADSLDVIDGAGLNDGDFAFVMTSSNVIYAYILNATSGAAESSPDVISPDTNAGTKRWILQESPYQAIASMTSAQLAGIISDETGSGALVFATSPVLVTPALGTPGSGVLVNCTGYPNINTTLPAFLAQSNTVQNNVTGDGTDYTVVFTLEIFDQVSNFDGTSTFTAPATGKYNLIVTLQFANLAAGHNVHTVKIITSNRTFTHTDQFSAGANPFVDTRTVTLSVLADLDVADTAYIVLDITGGAKSVTVVTGFCNFSGYLVG